MKIARERLLEDGIGEEQLAEVERTEVGEALHTAEITEEDEQVEPDTETPGSFRYRVGDDSEAELSSALDLSQAAALGVHAGGRTYVAPVSLVNAIRPALRRGHSPNHSPA